MKIKKVFQTAGKSDTFFADVSANFMVKRHRKVTSNIVDGESENLFEGYSSIVRKS